MKFAKPYKECELVAECEEELVFKCPWFYIICVYDKYDKRWVCARFDEKSALETMICKPR